MKGVPIIPGFEELDVGTHMWGREGREKKSSQTYTPCPPTRHRNERKYEEMDVQTPRWQRTRLQCRRRKRCGFDPWVRKIPQRRKRQPTPVFLPGKSHGQRSPEGYSPWGRKESDTTEATQHTLKRRKKVLAQVQSEVQQRRSITALFSDFAQIEHLFLLYGRAGLRSPPSSSQKTFITEELSLRVTVYDSG